MSTATYRDTEVKTSVEEELQWTADVDAAGIGVAVESGTVTLSGEVDSYAERLAARRAALRVHGVRAIVDDMTVHPKAKVPVTETDIAKEVDRALRGASNVPDTVQAVVDAHHVTLIGEVDWDHQRQAAQRAVQFLRGVYTVDNLVTLKPRASSAEAEDRIRRAFERSALIDAHAVHVATQGSRVILTGTVTSWAEKSEAAKAAWSSPHVTEVDNRLIVQRR